MGYCDVEGYFDEEDDCDFAPDTLTEEEVTSMAEQAESDECLNSPNYYYGLYR